MEVETPTEQNFDKDTVFWRLEIDLDFQIIQQRFEKFQRAHFTTRTLHFLVLLYSSTIRRRDSPRVPKRKRYLESSFLTSAITRSLTNFEDADSSCTEVHSHEDDECLRAFLSTYIWILKISLSSLSLSLSSLFPLFVSVIKK